MLVTTTYTHTSIWENQTHAYNLNMMSLTEAKWTVQCTGYFSGEIYDTQCFIRRPLHEDRPHDETTFSAKPNGDSAVD